MHSVIFTDCSCCLYQAAEQDLKEQRQQKKAAKAEKQKQLDAAWGDD